MRKAAGRALRPRNWFEQLLLQVLYSIRSERMLMEQISYNMLFPDRLLAHDVIVGLLNETVETAHARGYLSGEYFSVDATPIQARASRTVVSADAGGLQPHAHANAHGESGIEAKVGVRRKQFRPLRSLHNVLNINNFHCLVAKGASWAFGRNLDHLLCKEQQS